MVLDQQWNRTSSKQCRMKLTSPMSSSCSEHLCECTSFLMSNLDPSICCNCSHRFDSHTPKTNCVNFHPVTLFGELAKAKTITLFVSAPHSTSVDLRGSFDSWRNSYPLTKGTDGKFFCFIDLAEGRHQFKFVLDGVNWTCSSEFPTMKDPCGNENNFVDVSFSE
ncbi:hypothetical protein GEMRC1_004704 [Eukaryota sp. GEM-RC1]